MNNRIGIIILILICLSLGGVLVWKQNEHTVEQEKAVGNISSYSNKLVQADMELANVRQTNVELNKDLANHENKISTLSNTLTETSTTLSKTEENLKSTQEEVAKRDAKILDLESQNQALDQKALELGTAITNLTSQIDDTQKKLTASEGDKAFLEKELTRLIAEKAELEKQFNDLAVLRAQVAKLKEELNISRRLEWIRQGLFARADQKGAEQLMKKGPNVEQTPKPQPSYDLNVEVGADGTVRVIPPMTNNAVAPTNQVTVPPAPSTQ